MALLKDQVCIVTGAGQGLGRAVALEMAAEGATVVLLERNAETVEAVAAEIGGQGRPRRTLCARRHRLRRLRRPRSPMCCASSAGSMSLVNNAAINPPTQTILARHAGGLAAHDRDQPRSRLHGLEAGGAAYGAAEERTDHPHRLDPGLRVERRRRLLQRRQGRHHRADEVDGGRARAATTSWSTRWRRASC